MTAKVLFLLVLVLVAAASADRRRPYGYEDSHGSYESYESEEPKYEYSYKIKDYYGNDFGHEEKRDDDFTKGFFYLVLPNGQLQKVKYFVDGYSGFVADVSYKGEAKYDSGSHESYRPRYDPDSGSHEYYRPSYRSGYRGSDEY